GQVGPGAAHEFHGGVAVPGLADDLDVVLQVEQGRQCTSDQVLVVGQHDADQLDHLRVGAWPPSSNVVSSPAPTTRAYTSPPSAVNRSRRLSMPLPGRLS